MHKVKLLDRDPDLLGSLPSVEVDRLRREVAANAVSIVRGRCDQALYGLAPMAQLGALILDGFLLRRVCVEERRSIELLGPRDVIKPWVEADNFSLPVEVNWQAATDVELALLDEGLARAVTSAWPAVAAVFGDRLVQRSRWLALELAIAGMKGVDTRLLLTLWHLADRWGVVTTDGVVMPLPLTHEQLAEIVGSRRPSVSTAFGALSRRGLVSRRDAGWVLHGPPPSDLPRLDRDAAVKLP